MSQENVERVRSLYAKTERGDFSFLDRQSELRDFFAPEFEWHTREDLPDAGIRRGYEGLARLGAEWAEVFHDLHLDVDELIDAGDHVVAVARICGCLRGSGHQVEVEETQVWKMREGMATEVRAYLTRSHALEAVGLEE
jgi:ketosteroid isomerase-like protein